MTTTTLVERLTKLPTTALSDATGGHTNAANIKPLADHFKVAGRVLTIRLPDGENGAVLEAISKATKGDILVIDAKSNTNRAVAGDFVMQLAQGVGVQGFVVDGVIRDLAAARTIDFPVFALGTTVAAGAKNGTGVVGVPVAIGGVPVHTGDYIVGDLDGVIVIPQEDIEQVVAKAEDKLVKDEAREQEALHNGEQSIRAYLQKVIQ
ncbi:RraA family protein [Solibacillus sp. CAU 1738]|uniref:RraA family protein n=1 Tax=Solibacillus sp. CAU 1738 TaxID=3140363 RepID=UPI0032618C97